MKKIQFKFILNYDFSGEFEKNLNLIFACMNIYKFAYIMQFFPCHFFIDNDVTCEFYYT